MFKNYQVGVVNSRIRALPKGHRTSFRVISVTSGKGGVGKSNLVVNIAIALRRMGERVLILDGDFGLANIDILLNLTPKVNINDVIEGRAQLRDIISHSHYGVHVLPSCSGILGIKGLSQEAKSRITEELEGLDFEYDTLIIDTAAGIGSDVIWLNSTADDVVVVATPEPTSITDAYAMMKVLNQQYKIKKIKLLVNQVKNQEEGLKVYSRIAEVVDRFLHLGIDYVGSVNFDGNLTEAVRQRHPVITGEPDSLFSRNIKDVASSFHRDREDLVAMEAKGCFWQLVADAV